MQAMPAFFAVARSTSVSPTYTQSSAACPICSTAASTASGFGLRRTVALSPTAASSRPGK